MTITWAPVPDATEYWVYGRTPGGEAQYWKTTTPKFTDTGATPQTDASANVRAVAQKLADGI